MALKQQEVGTPVDEIWRQPGVSDATFYTWKKKYSGLSPSVLRRLKQLDEENAKLKRLVADLSPDKAMLCELNMRVTGNKLLFFDRLRERLHLDGSFLGLATPCIPYARERRRHSHLNRSTFFGTSPHPSPTCFRVTSHLAFSPIRGFLVGKPDSLGFTEEIATP